MSTTQHAIHISDCGINTTTSRGSDTASRIESTYMHLGINSKLYRQEDALSIAFLATTTAAAGYKITGKSHNPIAVNRAPRTEYKGSKNSGGGKLLYLKGTKGDQYIGYGEEVFEWLQFLTTTEVVKSVNAWGERHPDTTRGSQFRSLEHLVPIHSHSVKKYSAGEDPLEDFDTEVITDITPHTVAEGEGVKLPQDEFGNGRILMLKTTFENLIQKGETTVPEILGDEQVVVKTDLTDTVGGEIRIWRSSNEVPNSQIVIANFGRLWTEQSRENDPRITEAVPGTVIIFQ